MQIALLGGAFNPIHIGHLFLAQQFALAFPEAKLFFVPSSLSAHKSNANLILPSHRIKMIELALQDPMAASFQNRSRIETCEIDAGGVSYTANTIRQLKARYGEETQIFIVIGDDLVDGLPRWRDPNYLFEEATFVIASRNKINENQWLPPKHHLLNNSLLEISSTAIRDGLRLKSKALEMLPEGVLDYILKEGLYV